MLKSVAMASCHHAMVRSLGIGRVLAVLVFAGIIGGCVYDEAGRYYASEKYPPKPVEEVQVFLNEAPMQPYNVIADYQATGMGATVKFIREKAAKIGADAVIVSWLGGYRSFNDKWASDDRYSNTYSRITATAIKYTNEYNKEIEAESKNNAE